MFGYNKKVQKLKLSSKNICVNISTIKHTHIKKKKDYLPSGKNKIIKKRKHVLLIKS